jgi:glutamate racemase
MPAPASDQDPASRPPNPGSRLGIFDSGAGGLSVLREVARQLPHQEVLYFADSAHVPYGDREVEEIQALSRAITAFLIQEGAGAIVVACNTASAVALYHLREVFPVPIVGMEPALKPAAQQTRSRHVGVIATRATFQGQLFARLVERFAGDAVVHTQVCPGLVERVEAGLLDDADTEALLRAYLAPMLAEGIDSLVLGCTHYPFLRPALERVAGPHVAIIDPAPAVARQAGRVLAGAGLLRQEGQGSVTYFTSGKPAPFAAQVARLVAIPGPVRAIAWRAGRPVVRHQEAGDPQP